MSESSGPLTPATSPAASLAPSPSPEPLSRGRSSTTARSSPVPLAPTRSGRLRKSVAKFGRMIDSDVISDPEDNGVAQDSDDEGYGSDGGDAGCSDDEDFDMDGGESDEEDKKAKKGKANKVSSKGKKPASKGSAKATVTTGKKTSQTKIGAKSGNGQLDVEVKPKPIALGSKKKRKVVERDEDVAGEAANDHDIQALIASQGAQTVDDACSDLGSTIDVRSKIATAAPAPTSTKVGKTAVKKSRTGVSLAPSSKASALSTKAAVTSASNGSKRNGFIPVKKTGTVELKPASSKSESGKGVVLGKTGEKKGSKVKPNKEKEVKVEKERERSAKAEDIEEGRGDIQEPQETETPAADEPAAEFEEEDGSDEMALVKNEAPKARAATPATPTVKKESGKKRKTVKKAEDESEGNGGVTDGTDNTKQDDARENPNEVKDDDIASFLSLISFICDCWQVRLTVQSPPAKKSRASPKKPKKTDEGDGDNTRTSSATKSDGSPRKLAPAQKVTPEIRIAIIEAFRTSDYIKVVNFVTVAASFDGDVNGAKLSRHWREVLSAQLIEYFRSGVMPKKADTKGALKTEHRMAIWHAVGQSYDKAQWANITQGHTMTTTKVKRHYRDVMRLEVEKLIKAH